MTMKIKFLKLTPDLCDDYMHYFDNVAFTDHEEFSMCYCLESHITKQEDKLLSTRDMRRQKAMELINSGTMEGYLIYDGENVVGWCNTGEKSTYCSVADAEHETVDIDKHKVKVIYCIEIAPDYRGRGLAHLVIDTVCRDAKAEGYEYVESYPFLDEKFQYQYHGPIHLYDKHLFKKVADKSSFRIMSKKL